MVAALFCSLGMLKRGLAVGADLSTDNSKLSEEEQARIRKILYNQRALPVPD